MSYTVYCSIEESFTKKYVEWYEIARKETCSSTAILYVNKETHKVALYDCWSKPFKGTEYDYANKEITYNRIIYGSSICVELERLFYKRAHEVGIVIGSSHQKFEKENSREYYAPKCMEELFDTLVRHVQNNRESIIYLEDIYSYILNMNKFTFCRTKRMEGPYTDFVLSVNRPLFRRDVNNKNRNTFDFIDLEMVIRSSDASKEKVKENKKEIFDKAIQKLEQNKSFQRYGVPVNFLKMYQFVVHKDGSLTISFCLKEEKQNESVKC